jgi:glycosyltransferase involved in cell wall biosynthesis
MKILYDHQIFTFQKYGGISRYFAQIISNLPTDIKADIGIKYSDNEYLKQTHIVNNLQRAYQPIDLFFPKFKFPFKRKIFKYIQRKNLLNYQTAYDQNKKITIELLKKQDFDVFHPTYYDDYFLEYIGEKPFVLTIHDMIYELYPEMLNDPPLSKMKANLAKKAAHIIAVSEKTKEDIIEIMGIPANKISVVYHANSLTKANSTNTFFPNKYILFVGERTIYKNFMFFVRASLPLLKEWPDLHVVCVGRDFDFGENQLLKSLEIDNRFISKNVNDYELALIYKNAEALIFPSYYEGFGIPILEAFQAGCPVLLSNTSCFPEIAQDAALYFNPKSMDEIRSTINKVLNNEDLRKELIAKGYERSKAFSWEEAVNKTIKIYESVLNDT